MTIDTENLEMEDCVCISGCRRMQKQLQRKGIKFERYCNSRCTAYTPSLRTEWGKAVKERDGNKCVVCGSADHIEAHHIIPWYAGVKQRFLLSNGITLCRSCHVLAHDTEALKKYEEHRREDFENDNI